MGNTTSKPQGDSAASFPPSPTLLDHDGNGSGQLDASYTVRRRASNITKTIAATPSASSESAVGQPLQSRPSPSRSRPRSQTAAPALEHAPAGSVDAPRQQLPDAHFQPTVSSVPNVFGALQVDSESKNTANGLVHEGGESLELSGRSESEENYFVTPSQFGGPPRLPLPIEEEPLAPGSPIITPADLDGTLDDTYRGQLPRKSSTLSSTTADEEETTEDYQHASLDVNAGPLIPTLLEWRHGGKEVFVTGTFIGWNRKYKLHKDGPVKHSGVHSAIIGLPPGTHHITFLVDQQMHTSPDMPTAVDFTNALVNWIEVSEDVATHDVGKVENKTNPTTTSGIPVVARPGTRADTQGIHDDTAIQPAPAPHEESTKTQSDSTAKRAEASKPRLPPKIYHSAVPRVLIDLDASESSTRFARANTAVSTYPTPPSLPMFLNKSILNGSTPMKDDASVLIMPNHTVLNHLATSSIKNNVLATSATTRYKQKFLTTIMYKPTSDYHD